MRVAIFTHPGDTHAHAVAWGLRSRGCECDLLFLSDLPQKAVVTIDPAMPADVRFEGDQFSATLSDYDRFWLRKPYYPVLPPDLHAADRSIAQLYWEFTTDSLLRSLGQSGAFCINPPIATKASVLKAHHLTLASRAGLQIPRTRITNCGRSARQFIEANREIGANTITKGMELSVWRFEEGGFAVFSTVRVVEDDVDDASLKLAPCIFQAEETKLAEARVTVMGRTLFCARLDSQRIPGAELDFRHAPDWNDLGCEPVEPPANVREAILAFQDLAGLNFGTMDFIINRQGEWVFLETNPLGQFLWVEDAHPGTPLLDAFVHFVMSGSDQFLYDGPKDDRIRMQDYKKSLSDERKRAIATEKDRHVEVTFTGALDQPLANGLGAERPGHLS